MTSIPTVSSTMQADMPSPPLMSRGCHRDPIHQNMEATIPMSLAKEIPDESRIPFLLSSSPISLSTSRRNW